jgi:hypothetical protein
MVRPLPPIMIGLALLVALGAWGSRQYIVADPWSLYNAEVRAYLAAALQGDSTTLARKAASPQPAEWARNAARREPAAVAGWTHDLGSLTGERHGDTVAVVLTAEGAGHCSTVSSVSALFLNHTSAPRLLTIGSSCIDDRALPVLRARPVPGQPLTGLP